MRLTRNTSLLGIFTTLLAMLFASSAHAGVLLGTADSYGVIAGSTITNTGNSVINGDLGLHPGTSITGFPPGIINGVTNVNNAAALQAQTDLVTAYNDAAGRANTATAPADIGGGQTFTTGVYRTGSVPTMNLTGSVTLDAQGDPNAVFIFQVASALITATDSSVNLVNGAQSCNVFWQVATDTTIGTRTAFKGTVLGMNAITVNDAAAVQGRLLARNAAVTLINNTITRSGCATGLVDTNGDGIPDTNGGTGGTGGGGDLLRNDKKRPTIVVTGPSPLVVRDPVPTCADTNFTIRVSARDASRLRVVYIYLDGKRVKRTTHMNSALKINIRGLKVGKHTVRVVAIDRAGNRATMTRRFARCELAAPLPHFTG